MKDPDLAAYKAAAASLDDDDYTATGAPKMAILNDALTDAGYREITAAERDAFEAQIDAELAAAPEMAVAVEIPATEPAPTGFVTVTLTAADANPLPLYVHGLGYYALRVGVPSVIPEEALAALSHVSGVTFTKETAA